MGLDNISPLLSLKPDTKSRVYDLLSAAGLDVSDWANWKGGLAKAASNPRFCYSWSFIDPGVCVVLNIWHANLIDENGVIVQRLNVLQNASVRRGGRKGSIWLRRARLFDEALRYAFDKGVLIRAIICDGDMRDVDDPGASKSNVKFRSLDPVQWHVQSYDTNTGFCVIERGPPKNKFVDQFSFPEPDEPKKKIVTGSVYDRNRAVRNSVLRRAGGCCEYCGARGFETPLGNYLETHHIVSLSYGGSDDVGNVIALCPNDHRRAHFSVESEELTAEFKEIVSRISS
jgi:5-methylcytosine-specific restriction enzyme A